MTGRPPIPVEQKMLRGTHRPGRTPMPETGRVSLERAHETPQPLAPLEEAGARFWALIWEGPSAGWISPHADIQLVQLVAEQLDERQELRERVRTGATPRDRSGLREIEKQIAGNLAALGLNPSDRGRLGFGIVKTESKLKELMRRRDEIRGAHK